MALLNLSPRILLRPLPSFRSMEASSNGVFPTLIRPRSLPGESIYTNENHLHQSLTVPKRYRIVDCNKGGHWSISPRFKFRTKQQYMPQSNVLATKFLNDNGIGVVTGETISPRAAILKIG